MKNKVMSVEDALALIKDGDQIAISAVGGTGYPDYIAAKLEEKFLNTGHPAGLTLYSAGGHGSGGREHSCDARFAHPGFLKRQISTHPKACPELRTMFENNEIEGYVLPQGIMNQLYRTVSARQPGLLSKVGLGTYIDPRQDGGKLNSIAKEDIVRVMEIDGEEWLFYKSFPVNVALIRGTYADENGSVTIDREPLKLEMLECAMAAKAAGGIVIVQVEHAVERYSLNPKDVVIPCALVDAVVEVENPEIYHKTGRDGHNPYVTGEARAPKSKTLQPQPEQLKASDAICRRAAHELFPGAVANLGVGIGAGVGMVSAVEGFVQEVNFCLEMGVFGGTPLAPPKFGSHINPESYISPPVMFDFYHGGNLDLAFLGAAEIDKDGNVNVSKFAGHANGQGGFLDISISAKKAVFCTTLRTQGLEAEIADGKINIIKEGRLPKFVEKVEQITFNGKMALKAGHEAYYVTERAVFRLSEEGLVLIEIAPGVDLEKDVLQQMNFKPIVDSNLKIMDDRIFRPGKMGCFDKYL